MGETRKIAAILVADVVGYSRLAGAGEDRTLARLRALRSDLIDPTIAVHHGRIVKRTGDGSLIELRSVVDAVRCAIEVAPAAFRRISRCRRGLTRLVLGFMGFEARHVGNPEACGDSGCRRRRLQPARRRRRGSHVSSAQGACFARMAKTCRTFRPCRALSCFMLDASRSRRIFASFWISTRWEAKSSSATALIWCP